MKSYIILQNMYICLSFFKIKLCEANAEEEKGKNEQKNDIM